MKNFKQYTEMARAKDIKSSQLLSAKSYDEAIEIIKYNMQELKVGEGWYSKVYGTTGEPFVVKISDSAIDGAHAYLELAKEVGGLGSNSGFPRVAHLQGFQIGSGYIAIMEMLNFDPEATAKAWKVKEWYNINYYNQVQESYRTLSYWAYEYFFEGENEMYERFKKVLPNMHKTFERLYTDSETGPLMRKASDIHYGNVACRGNVPVLVDPIGNNLHANYNRTPFEDDFDEYEGN